MSLVKASKLVAATSVAILTVGLGAACSTPVEQRYNNCEIYDKDRTSIRTDYGSRSDMRVYTSCTEFAVRDVYGIRDSARIYGQIKVGDICTIWARGTRNPSRSQFPYITSTECESPVDNSNPDTPVEGSGE